MTEKKITFIHTKTDSDISEIYNFNMQAFADSHDFAWTTENIKNEIESGWEIFSVRIEKDIICAIFVKISGDTLLTKNTPIKLNYQGQGFSHIIKDFYEEFAKNKNIAKVLNYCPVDNFRMISLNEGHDYKRTGRSLGDNENMIEWEKTL